MENQDFSSSKSEKEENPSIFTSEKTSNMFNIQGTLPLQNQKSLFTNIIPAEFDIFKSPINPFSIAAPFDIIKTNKLKEKKVKKAKKIKLQQAEEEEEEKGEPHENNKNNEDDISVDGYIDLSKMKKPNSLLARTVSLKRSSSLKNKPLFPDDLSQSTISIAYENDSKVIKINLDHNNYTFDLSNPIIKAYISNDLKELIDLFDEFKPFYSSNQSNKIPEIIKITDH